MSNRFHIMQLNCEHRVTLLAFFWVSGQIIGTLIAARFPTGVSIAPDFVPSFWQILFVSLLPLLASIFAYNRSFALLIFVAFLKATSFGFSSVLLICSFGSAGWLVRVLSMFSAILSAFVIWLLWLHLVIYQKERQLSVFGLATLSIVFVSLLDVYVIEPIVQRLIPYL